MPHDLSSLDPVPMYVEAVGDAEDAKEGVGDAEEVMGDADRDVPLVDVQEDFGYVNLHLDDMGFMEVLEERRMLLL
ncbi:hypothetical protein CDL15_Pgr006506 [Punica granatum]|uniref:Uncharacterized protein n=1 Tax=Punica granatum TaxID=22663 RepID=A0A218XYI5_PUNGR|nr:hypothetical protein CDL15_Pgr006506 [Punica granatum]